MNGTDTREQEDAVQRTWNLRIFEALAVIAECRECLEADIRGKVGDEREAAIADALALYRASMVLSDYEL